MDDDSLETGKIVREWTAYYPFVKRYTKGFRAQNG